MGAIRNRAHFVVLRNNGTEMRHRASKITYREETLDLISQAFGLAGFFAIDSSTVSLDLRKFPWSVPQEGSGGIKLHTIYDLLADVRKCQP